MSFEILFADPAAKTFNELEEAAKKAFETRQKQKKTKSSRQEGLFKQVRKTIQLLGENPKHTGLHTHEYSALPNPFNPKEKVFEAYAQNNTPGAYRVFWCYGPDKKQITIIAITPHP
ncbi:MAG: hypothetical protein ACOVP4_02145 [Bacteriovoracaceae bacterium]